MAKNNYLNDRHNNIMTKNVKFSENKEIKQQKCKNKQ